MQRSRRWGSVCAAEAAAVGGAPEEISAATEVAAAMDAHYRRSCGRWQTFWSRRCPLLQPGLRPLDRAAYAGRCLQALASGPPPAPPAPRFLHSFSPYDSLAASSAWGMP